jgi:hypothetical protein
MNGDANVSLIAVGTTGTGSLVLDASAGAGGSASVNLYAHDDGDDHTTGFEMVATPTAGTFGLVIDASAGTLGQVLTAQGDETAIWDDPSGGATPTGWGKLW